MYSRFISTKINRPKFKLVNQRVLTLEWLTQLCNEFLLTHIIIDNFQTTEPLPDEDEDFELPEDIQPFLQDTPLYSDNTANG